MVKCPEAMDEEACRYQIGSCEQHVELWAIVRHQVSMLTKVLGCECTAPEVPSTETWLCWQQEAFLVLYNDED